MGGIEVKSQRCDKRELGIFFLDEEKEVQSYNPLINELSGLDWEEFIGQKISEVNNRLKRSEEKKLEIELRRLLDNKGGLAGYVGLCFKKNKEDKLTEEDLLASTLHELKNPLTNIKGFVQHIENKLNNCDNREADKYLDKLTQEIDYLNLLINRFLQRTKLKNSHPKVLELNKVIKEVIFLMKGEFLEKEIEIECDLTEKQEVYCEYIHIKQVLLNIIKNAIDAVANVENKRIRINTKSTKDKQYNVILIEDNGIGISDEDLKRIFTPFYTTKEKGCGLGLSTSRKIIENYGGGIEIESLDKGTKFMVYLPEI
jgi:signal transduction histidine kinase